MNAKRKVSASLKGSGRARLCAALKAGLQDIEAGRVVPHDEIRQKILRWVRASSGDALLAEIEVIAEFPFSYREVPEFERPSIRELVFPPYRVIFRITKEQSIEIVRIWHAARGPVEI
jgi:hypothetical protein